MVNQLNIVLLGTPEVRLHGKLVTGFVTSKAEALFYFLAITRKNHLRSKLAGFFWPDVPDAVARKNLRDIVFNLRKVVGDYLIINRNQIGFAPQQPHWVDVHQLRAQLSTEPEDLSIQQLTQAVALYQGDLLEGFYIRDAKEFEDWLIIEREQIRLTVIHALHRLAAHYLEVGAWNEGLQITQRLLMMEPWDEAAHRQQMRLLVGSGQRGAALAQYERCQQVLAKEFAIEPAEETQALYRFIQTGDLQFHTDLAQRSMPTMANGYANHHLPTPDERTRSLLQHDLEHLPRTALFIGREKELTELTQAVIEEGKRLIAVVGFGGQGKTALVAHFTTAMVHRTLLEPSTTTSTAQPDLLPTHKEPRQFQRILWYSCHHAPPLTEVLTYWLHQLTDQRPKAAAANLDELFAQLFEHLQRDKCLLILDNFESFLQSDAAEGGYRKEYEGYELLLEKMAAMPHQGCLIVTSREQPRSFLHLVSNWHVLIYPLKGMSHDDGLHLLTLCGLSGQGDELHTLVDRYAGNPLALRIMAETVNELFAGDLAMFLSEQTLILDDIRHILAHQFVHLSPLELEIILWLAIEREMVTPQQIWDNLVEPPVRSLFFETLRSLQRRFLVEWEERHKRFTSQLAVHFTLHSVVMEYATDYLITEIKRDLEQEQFHTLQRYTLLKAQSPEYVRQMQQRLLLMPVAKFLQNWWGEQRLVQRFAKLLNELREQNGSTSGYVATNLLQLMSYLNVPVTGCDFSELSIHQADLRHMALTNVNFSNTNLANNLFANHFGRVTAVAFSPDNALLATATTDRDIRLWALSTGQLIGICRGNHRWVWSIAFSPDGQMLASGCSDNMVRLWSLRDICSTDNYTTKNTQSMRAAVLLQTFKGHTDAVFAVAFSPDGKIIASGSGDASIILWDVTMPGIQRTLNGHRSAVTSVAFYAANNDTWHLISGSLDQTISLWQRDSNEPIGRLNGHEGSVTAVAVNATGPYLITGSTDATVRVWDLATQQIHRVFDNELGTVLTVACNNNDLIAAAGYDHLIYIWDLHTGTLQFVLEGHNGEIQDLAFAIDGYTLVSGGTDQSVRLWDTRSGQALQTYQGYHNTISSLALSHDERLLVNSNVDRSLSLWLCPSGQHRAISRASASRRKGVYGINGLVAFHPDQHLLASAGADGIIHLWNMAEEPTVMDELHCQLASISALAFHPNGKWLAVGTMDATIYLWQLDSGTYTVVRTGQQKPISSIGFTPDGHYLITHGEQSEIFLWELARWLKTPTGHMIHLNSHPSPQLNGLPAAREGSIHQNGHASPSLQITVGERQGPHTLDDLNLHDVSKPQIILQTTTENVMTVAVSPNGRFLAVGGANPWIELWQLGDFQSAVDTFATDTPVRFSAVQEDVEYGSGTALVKTLTTNSTTFTVAFSPDNKFIATGDGAGDISVWELATDTQIALLSEHNGAVQQILFADHGRRLYSGSDDETIRVWENGDEGWALTAIWQPRGIYQGLNLAGATGINVTQRAALFALGAVEEHLPHEQTITPHNLPPHLPTLFGRNEEVRTLLQHLLDDNTRVLTILGEGGVGKTSVALAMAQAIITERMGQGNSAWRADFADGVWLVSFSDLRTLALNAPIRNHYVYNDRYANSTGERIAAAIGRVLQLSFRGTLPLQQQLFDHLRTKRLLLIGDDCGVLEGEATFWQELLHAAPAVKVVLTTAQHFKVLTQITYRLEGLHLPPKDISDQLDSTQLLTYSSIQLFLDRVQRHTDGFALTVENCHLVVQLCHVAGGVPLAIELAVAQMREYTLTEIIHAIQTDLFLLQSPTADLPTRQQSLQAIVAHAWQTLPPDLGTLLIHCSIFPGKFDLEAAMTIANATPTALQALIDRSLLHATEDGRFFVHQFVRTFAHTQPAHASTIGVLQERHALYYATLLAQKGQRINSTATDLYMLQQNLENIRLAWQWLLQQIDLIPLPGQTIVPSLAEDELPRLAEMINALMRSKEGLFYLYERLGYLQEAFQIADNAIQGIRNRHSIPSNEVLSTKAIRSSSELTILLANLLLELANLHEFLGNLAEMNHFTEEAITLAQSEQTAEVEARGFYFLAIHAQQQGQINQAQQWLEQAERLAQDHELRTLQIACLNLQGILYDMKGKRVDAKACYAMALPLAIQDGDCYHEKLLVNNLGLVTLAKGEWAEAQQYLERNLVLSNLLGNPTKHVFALMNHALLLDALGRYDEAEDELGEALQIAEAIRHRQAEAYIYQFLAMVHFHTGMYERGRTVGKKALLLIEQYAFLSMKAQGLAYLAHNLVMLDELEEALAAYEESITLWQEMKNQQEIGMALIGYAYTAVQLGKIKEAEAMLEAALVLLDTIIANDAAIATWFVLASYLTLHILNDKRMLAVVRKGHEHLLKQAAQIPDAATRETFLTDVLPNRTIVRVMQENQ